MMAGLCRQCGRHSDRHCGSMIREKVYRETDLVQQYPILIDIFLDNDIINFILCDSIDMFIGQGLHCFWGFLPGTFMTGIFMIL